MTKTPCIYAVKKFKFFLAGWAELDKFLPVFRVAEEATG